MREQPVTVTEKRLPVAELRGIFFQHCRESGPFRWDQGRGQKLVGEKAKLSWSERFVHDRGDRQPPRGVKLPRLRPKTRSSRLESRFALYWRGNGPGLKRKFVFHAERKWRSDFAHVESRMLIEVEGGIFIKGGGRHNRAAGFIADAGKYLAAFLDGWNVVRLTEAQITAPNGCLPHSPRRIRREVERSTSSMSSLR